MKPATLGSAIALLLIASSLPVQAQVAVPAATDGTVNGSGDVVLERLPDTMRMQVSLLSKASTLKEALDLLKKRVEAATAQLVEFGADKESIEAGSPKLTSIKNPQQQQMEQMLRQRMKRGGRKPPAAPVKTPIVVSVDLKADWKLSAKTAEELLLATHPLQEKVKAADLAGAEEAAKVTAEEQEALEEAESEFGGYSSDGESKPGEPVFFFIAKFPADEIDKALAEGFQKAKADAERTCKIAGLKLGPLTSLSNSSAADLERDQDPFGYANYSAANSTLYRHLQRQRNRSDKSLEATGIQPESVRYAVSVQAAFRLLPE